MKNYLTIYSPRYWAMSFFIISTSCWSLSACRQPEAPGTEANRNVVSTYVPYNLRSFKDGPIEQAQFGRIGGIAFDKDDNLYIADYWNNRVRKVSADGKTVSTFAGSGEENLDIVKDGPAATANFYRPTGLAFDKAGNLYVSQEGAVRKISPNGLISTLVGVLPRNRESIGDSVGLADPWGITVDETGNVYATGAGTSQGRVVRITPNRQASSFAGFPLYRDYPLKPPLNLAIPLVSPNGLAYDSNRKYIYITDKNRGVFRVGMDGKGDCMAGCERIYAQKDGPVDVVRFADPIGGICDKVGNVYLGDKHAVRKLTPDGIVNTVAGTGKAGYKDGPGDQALLNNPSYFAFDSKGNLYVSDDNGVRKIVFPK
jgi:sugar lactone lactonase YvrE